MSATHAALSVAVLPMRSLLHLHGQALSHPHLSDAETKAQTASRTQDHTDGQGQGQDLNPDGLSRACALNHSTPCLSKWCSVILTSEGVQEARNDQQNRR